jgi:phosphoglucosamine mutase
VSRKHFGTDGIRGVANTKLTPELAFSVGQAAGRYLIDSGQTNRVVLGMDTRRSGPMLAAALSAGFASVNTDVVDIGVAPTPAVSFAARTGDFSLGAIISASHNPAPDNGLKFVGHDGRKLPDAVEQQIETLMETPLGERPTGACVGWLSADHTPLDAYLDFLTGIVPSALMG